MTREQKLALILGFVLVLGVGVMISDHLSGAHRSRQATPDSIAKDDAERSPEESEGSGLITWDSAPDRDIPISGSPDASAAEQRTADASDASDGSAWSDFENLSENFRTPPGAAEVTERSGSRDSRNGTGGSDDVRTHTVEKGDTFWGIAERYYGRGGMHASLLEYNRDRLGADGTLTPGVTLEIPEADALANGAGGAAQEADRERVYTVKKGETLSEIAAKALGSSRRWKEILSLNSDKLDDATDLREGMRISLPPRENGTRTASRS